METLQIFLSGLVSSGIVVTAAVYLFRLSLEKRLEKEILLFKAGLNEELERLKSNLATELEAVRSELRTTEAMEQAKFQALLDFRAQQLSEFYIPLYLGLQKDNVIWPRILDKRDSEDELKRKIGAAIEEDVILPNHERMVGIIEKNLHLAEADEELEEQLLRYIRHVALYRAIRAAGEPLAFPDDEDKDAVWPEKLFPAIETRTKDLQQEFNRLLRLQSNVANEGT